MTAPDPAPRPSRAGSRCTLTGAVCAFLVAWMAAAAGAAPTPFHFSTGAPDGEMASASHPGPESGPNPEAESADDFVVSAQTAIDHAAFTGLLPAGVPLSDITQVRVAIYRVFPKDSNAVRTPQVPTRTNSPGDVAYDARDSAAGTLTFTASILAPSFTAQNSVDSGIYPLPHQTTGGEGPVSGQEVLIDAALATPFDLPRDHYFYFFVPQVLLQNPDDHFLWLSAPRPIGADGTPFSPDLQSWIRTAPLAPDWLRIATDIVGSNPMSAFNGSFSLDGESGIAPAPTATPLVVTVVGDCAGTGKVTIANALTLLNIVLGLAPASACAHGIPRGHAASIALILQAVNNILNG